MKVADGLKVIENGWIRKPKGYRVRFQQPTDSGIETVYSPPQDAAPLNSDVTAWRYAWKLWQATVKASERGETGAMYNITVVDDLDAVTVFYGSGQPEIYNPRTFDSSEMKT